ncbi:unnamed protein product [Ectocarpus fasciculatus]
MEGDAGSESAGAGHSGYLTLKALVVTLNETCDGTSWYTSTVELQLASLEICVACRTYRTMHLKVDPNIPRWLLAASDAQPPHPTRLGRTRVPRLKARRVTWNMRTAEALVNPILTMTDVDCLKFGHDFEGSLEAVTWPRRLKSIDIGSSFRFNNPIDMIEWPESLQTLEFGWEFNRPIERAHFPESLQKLVLVGCFDQPIAGGCLPSSLQQLDLGEHFNQPIEDVLWPDSLQRLVFGNCFNQPIDNVKWPASLEQVSFGLLYFRGVDRAVMFSEFNQSIASCIWPASMRLLTLGDKFRQSLHGLGKWMPSLEEFFLLGYDSGDDSLLRGIEWPEGLRQLTLFQDSSSDGVVVPTTVQILRLFNDTPRW